MVRKLTLLKKPTRIIFCQYFGFSTGLTFRDVFHLYIMSRNELEDKVDRGQLYIIIEVPDVILSTCE